MDLIAIAVPFFMLALALELIIDWQKGSGLYRSSDAINSLSAGILSTTIGYFTRFLPLLAWGFVLRNFALIDMQPEWFDLSASGLLLWVIAALAWDFCYYWFHRFSHEISVLWAAHAVHHQSEDYNLSTALRQTSTGFLFGWIFYLPLFLIGFPLEVLITVNAINLIYQFWVHTQMVRRLGTLDRILVTPSNHRVHHAQNERYIDKNYGGMLILWDRFFGTFEDESDEEPVIFGVRKPLANLNPFWANLQVYDYLLFDARKAARWRDKVAIWFRHTGWRPTDVEARYPKQQTDLSRFQKFDPQTAPQQRHYVMAQFIIAIAGALVIAELYARKGTEAVLIPCILLWLQLYTLGLLNEGRPAARRFEWLRLLLAVPVLSWLLQAGADGLQLKETGGWVIVALYSVVSATWLALIPRAEEQLLTQ
ncbi:MAG: sterol desaturase family protein [Gammaproteobacteria bacterium]|nr:sterol desaturase family protein [Gammaproteobacteria bacterium]MDH3480939.1 sterol desaturase family protein [Gammaproteobacteria bacterium]